MTATAAVFLGFRFSPGVVAPLPGFYTPLPLISLPLTLLDRRVVSCFIASGEELGAGFEGDGGVVPEQQRSVRGDRALPRGAPSSGAGERGGFVCLISAWQGAPHRTPHSVKGGRGA